MRWTDEEKKTLIDEYSKGRRKELEKKLGRSWCSIQHKANRIGLKKDVIELKGNELLLWSDKEVNMLNKLYLDASKSQILKNLPGRSWVSIYNKAFILGLKRNKSYGDLSILLEDNNQTYYWIGFLMADGHFSKSGDLQVNLAKKDMSHLIKLAKFINHKKELKNPRLSIKDKEVIQSLKNKFDIKSNKTYNPCNVKGIVDEELLFSLIIGFIDGDGSIKQSKGRTGMYIKCHNSWLRNLQFFSDFLCKDEEKKYTAVTNKDGLAVTWITDLIILKNIKRRAIDLNLPVLNRKWKNIDLNKKTKKELSAEIKDRCISFFEMGLAPMEVVKKSGHSTSIVYKHYNYWKRDIDRALKG